MKFTILVDDMVFLTNADSPITAVEDALKEFKKNRVTIIKNIQVFHVTHDLTE